MIIRSGLLITSLFFAGILFAQNDVSNENNSVIYPSEFKITKPLHELVGEYPFVENKEKKESSDKVHRIPQTFLFTAEDGPEFGEDPLVRQTSMGTKNVASSKALIENWPGQYSGSRPMDPTGAAGPDHYVQAINASPFRVFDKVGNILLTANIGTLWNPSTTNDGDPIVMYDKYADRWFLSQFGTSGNQIYIAISTTSDPTGSYYAYTFTSPQFPDYLKFSIWENGYYMTSNQWTDKVFCFERDQMILGNPSARAISANFSTGTVSSFFVPLPADAADGGLPPAGTPLPFFCYTENSWGGGNVDGVKIWNMTVNWSAPSASISLNTTIPTSAFDGTYSSSWNDIPQPNTTQKLDGIGGVPTYRAQWRPWNGYNTILLNWGVKISTTQRSIRWVELRQDQGTGTWSLYQESTYAPDGDSRWLGSIAMDDNGSIGLAYCKSSSTTYPTLCYTGRNANDPLGTMTFSETVAANGTSSQSGINRFGDYSHTSLDPNGVTFWHTGEYISGSVLTRIYSFQIPDTTVPPIAKFVANKTISCISEIQFNDLSVNNPTSWLWDFGDGQSSTDQNPIHNYSANGTYTVSLTSSNSNGDNQIVKSNYITINIPASPTAIPGNRCGTGSANISASGSGTIFWYDSLTGGNQLGTGNNLATPIISITTDFYAENHIESASQYVGPSNDSTGGQFTNTATSIIFSCYNPCTIVSVSVNANGDGNRTFQLQNSTGTVLQSVTSFVPSGVSRVQLNFDVPVENNLKLYVAGNSQLYRLITGFSFPYSINGLINLTSCSTINRYGLVYDWEIREPDCISSRIPVAAIVDSLPPIANFTFSSNQLDFSFTSTSNGADYYLWNFGDGSTSTDMNPNYSYAGSGMYTVTLIVSSNCGADTIIQEVNAIGSSISNNSSHSPISIFPNPSNGIINISFKEALQYAKINIENTLGEIIYSEKIYPNQNDIFSFDLKKFSKGIYFVNVTSKNYSLSSKIIYLK